MRCGTFRILKARCAASVVPAPVVQRVVRWPVVRSARCAGVVQTPVMRKARFGQPDRVRSVVPITARCAGCDPKCAWFQSRPVVPAWFCADVVGTCHSRSEDGDRSAEHGIAADRFAREIVYILTRLLQRARGS